MFDAPRILLALAVAMILLIVVAAFSYETTWSNPPVHPNIATMEIGGERAADDANNWLLGLVFGVTMILLLVVSLFLAPGQSQNAVQRKLAIASGGVVYVAVFVVMMLRYRDYALEGPSLLGPFTTPTTWMVFGLWIAPAVFVVIYCAKFETWFGSEDPTQSEGGPK